MLLQFTRAGAHLGLLAGLGFAARCAFRASKDSGPADVSAFAADTMKAAANVDSARAGSTDRTCLALRHQTVNGSSTPRAARRADRTTQ